MKTRNNNGISVRLLVMILALTLIVGGIVGGSVAWLTAQTAPVVNTFTVGDINITLAETTNAFKMVPGNPIAKDPKVTVEAGSEACWLFVKVEESSNLDNFVTYTIADGWTKLSENGNTAVYYREVAAIPSTGNDSSFYVLKDNKVTVNDNVTKEMMNALETTGATQPTLTFTAYAVQKDNIGTAAEAWAIANS